MEDEYLGLYGLFSKYVHPSAWLIVKPDKAWAKEITNTFVVRAQTYAMDLAYRGAEGIGLSYDFATTPWSTDALGQV